MKNSEKIRDFMDAAALPFRILKYEGQRFFSTNPPPIPMPAAMGRALGLMGATIGSALATEKYDLHPLTFVFVFFGLLFLILLQNYIRGIALDMNPPPDADDQR